MPIRRISVLACCGLLACGLAGAQAAGGLRVNVHIEAQPVRIALQQFGEQAGVQVLMRLAGRAAEDIEVSAVNGEFTVQEALARMLENTGLTYEFVNERTVRIVDAQAASSTAIPPAASVVDPPAKEAIHLAHDDPVPAAAATAGDPESPQAGGRAGNDANLEEIVVSGSRIARPEADSPIPLVTYSSRDIERSGEIDIAKFLTSSPALVNSTVSRVPAIADSQSNLDLRGLGTNRTLVLVNGRRHVAGSTSSAAVDVNSIPTDLIERIDIVTGGTSAVYGADAVSGVVNFILKRDFEGLAARSQLGQSSRGDAEERFLSVLAGKNFAGGRGNVTLSLEHADYRPLFSEDRRFRAQRTGYYGAYELNAADDPDDPNIPDYIPLLDNRINNGALSGGFDTGGPDESGNYVPGAFDGRADFTGAGDVFDHGTNDRGYMTSGGSGTPSTTAYNSQLQAAEQRSLVNLLATYEISPAMRLFGEGKFVQQKYLTNWYLTYDVGSFISPENPYIPAALREAMDPTQGFYLIERDNLDLGMPRSRHKPQTLQGVVGSAGALTDGLNYEASIAYGQTKVRRRVSGDRYQDRFLAATDVIAHPDTGQPVCRSDLFPETFPPDDWTRMSFTPGAGSGCVPYNVFGDDVASAEAKQWVLFTSEIAQKITQRVANLTFDGNLDSLIRPPAGSVGFAAGVEYRRESISLEPDAQIRDGMGFADFGSGTQAQVGAYDVKEVFGELNIPLVSKRRFVDELSLGLAGRYSDYSTAGGDVTWNVNLVYGPIRGLRFRGALSRAVRAPNLIEAFAAPSVSREFVDDPCDVSNVNNGTSFREDNCRALLTGLGVDPADFRPNESQSGIPISATTRGNPGLDPEEAEVLTAGVLIDGLLLRGLSVSVDWYDVDLTGAIDTVEPLALCVDAPTIDNEYCAAITRDASGETAGYIRSYLIQPTNVSSVRTSGLDMTVNYGFATPIGEWNLRLVGGYLHRLSFASVEGAEVFENAGLWGAPKYVVDADVTWNRGPVTVNYGVSWWSQMNVLDDLTLAAEPDYYPAEFLKVGPRWKHDVQLSFQYDKRLSLFGSINNLTDEKPFPVSTSYPVDSLGRYYSIGAKVSFQ